MNNRTTMNGKPVFTVPAKTVINFDSRFDKKKLCDGITFTAGNACTYQCSFCYVEDMQRKAREWHEKHGVSYPEAGHMGVVIRIQDAVELARKQILSKSEAFRRSKKVIYASPKVDVAGNMELVRETVAICAVILELTNWDIRLLSKSNLLPKVALMLDAMEGGCYTSDWELHGFRARIIYGVSTGTLDDNLAKAFEQGTPLVSKRIESLHWLQDHGYRTFGMVCPSLPQRNYDLFSQEMMAAIRADRCEHVWAEVINVRGDSYDRTIKALRDGGFEWEAQQLVGVGTHKLTWEHYARDTFRAHQRHCPLDKLQFLQYVTKNTRPWWENEPGAVLL